MQEELEYLNTLILTGEYLNFEPAKYPELHDLVVNFTKSPKSKFTNNIHQSNISIKQKIRNDELIRLYILQLRIELIMSEFILASGTLSRIKDLFGSIGLNEDLNALTLVVILRSELIEVEACLSLKDFQSDDLIDKLASIKLVINSYIDKSTNLLVNQINRTNALSMTTSNIESMIENSDLYPIIKRKITSDKNLSELAIHLNNKINPLLSTNESIESLFELINLKPLDIQNYYELALIYLNLSKLKESLYCIGQCLLIGCSNSWNLWAFRGELCYLLSKCDNKNSINWLYASISSFSYSLELCNDFIRSWCGLYITLKYLINFKNNNNNSKNNDNLKKFEIDETYEKMFDIVVEKLQLFKNDNVIPVAEREKIIWCLDRN